MGGVDVDHIKRLFIPEKGGAVGGPRLLLEKTQVVFLFRHGSRRTPTGFVFPPSRPLTIMGLRDAKF